MAVSAYSVFDAPVRIGCSRQQLVSYRIILREADQLRTLL